MLGFVIRTRYINLSLTFFKKYRINMRSTRTSIMKCVCLRHIYCHFPQVYEVIDCLIN